MTHAPVPGDKSPLHAAAVQQEELLPGTRIIVVDQEQGILEHGVVLESPALYNVTASLSRLAVYVELDNGERHHFYLSYMGIAKTAKGKWSTTVYTILEHNEHLIPNPLPILTRKGEPSSQPPVHWK